MLTTVAMGDSAINLANANTIALSYGATDNTPALLENPGRSQSILEPITADRSSRADPVAGVTVLLASPATAYVSGILLPADGGWLDQ